MSQKNSILTYSYGTSEYIKSVSKEKKQEYSLHLIDFIENNETTDIFNSHNLNQLSDILEVLKKIKVNKNSLSIPTSEYIYYDKNVYDFIDQNTTLLACDYNTFNQLKDIKSIHKELEDYDISFPITLYKKSIFNKQYLIKKKISSGGLDTFFVSNSNENKFIKDKYYFQEYIDGTNYSVSFIALKDKTYSILGFNKIFSKKTPYSDFSFSGCLRQVKFDDKYLDTIINCIDYFISNFNIIGFCSIDFIIKDKFYFLEINPRLSQSHLIYKSFFNNQLIDAHIKSYNNELMNINYDLIYRGFEHLFAKKSFKVNNDIKEKFILNGAKNGDFFNKGDPVCTIFYFSDNENELIKERDNVYNKAQNIFYNEVY